MPQFNEEPIHIGELPIIRNAEQLRTAAAGLAVHSGAYIVEKLLPDEELPLASASDQVDCVRRMLEIVSPGWLLHERPLETDTLLTEVGLHGQPDLHYSFFNNDFVRLLNLHRGAATVITALAGEEYDYRSPVQNRHLANSLANKEVDPSLAVPVSYMQGEMEQGMSLLIRNQGHRQDRLLSSIEVYGRDISMTSYNIGRTLTNTELELLFA